MIAFIEEGLSALFFFFSLKIQLEGEYCMKICPNRNGNICLCGGGDDCNAPHTLKEQISLWLDIEA